MLDKIKKIWKKRKVIGQVIKHVKQNPAWIGIILKAIRFSKDGYTRLEIAELVSDALSIFKLRASIAYEDDKVTLSFYMAQHSKYTA